MYEKFFNFKEKPFKLVPNPAYLFLSKSHEETLAHLNYALAEGDGFVEITQLSVGYALFKIGIASARVEDDGFLEVLNGG